MLSMTRDPATAEQRSFGLPLIALAVAVVVGIWLSLSMPGRLQTTLGDTDDAMRLMMVRALLTGETTWFHPHLARLQPPLGLDMHWSRLVDGGMAAMIWLFERFMPLGRAETAMRLLWPLAWALPAIWAVLAIGRRLGGPAVLIPALCLLVLNPLLYAQWQPGRIDHHNLQIVFSLAALAGGVAGGRRGGVLAGAATGLGMAIGLESLAFLAVAGASFALRFLFAPKAEAPAARAYAISLLVSVSLFYLAQTPPPLLTASVCDALAANLWCAVAVAGLGLIATIWGTQSGSLALRVAALAGVGAASATTYLALDPLCLHGPLAGADPRLKTIWLDRVSEMQPLLSRIDSTHSEFGICSLVLIALAAASWAWLGRRAAGRTPAWWLLGVMLGASLAIALSAERMVHYANWFAVPLVAAALSDLGQRYWRSSPIPIVVLAMIFSQPALIAAIDAIPGWERPADPANTAPCTRSAAFPRLAGLPPGLVLSEINLGPNVVAHTRDSVVAAPYHRMAWGILAARRALAAGSQTDEREARALGVAYVVDCPAHAGQRDHLELGPQSLQARLDRFAPPRWLEPLSSRTDPLQIYRVRSEPASSPGI
jgi:hypothetical protein